MAGALLQAASVVREPLSASANKSAVSGGGSGFSACGNPGSTDSVTVTPSGGTAPYSYLWTLQGSPATRGPYSCSNINSAGPVSWSDTSVCELDAQPTETWRCTVTDDNGKTATVDVTVTLTWANLS